MKVLVSPKHENINRQKGSGSVKFICMFQMTAEMNYCITLCVLLFIFLSPEWQVYLNVQFRVNVVSCSEKDRN